MDSTSESLIRRLQNPRDEDAWNRCVEIYTPMIVRWTNSVGLPKSEADDVTQNIMLKLHREMQNGFKYDPTRSFRAWLCAVSRNTARNYLRDAGKHQLAELVDAVDSDYEEKEGVFCKDLFSHLVLDGLLRQLKDEFKATSIEAFIKCKCDGQSAKEAGAALGISETAVRQAIYRIWKRLQILAAGMLD